MFRSILSILLIIITFQSCSKFIKAKDLITKPSAREIYKRELDINEELFGIWEKVNEQTVVGTSANIDLPYRESGKFFPKSYPIYSYTLKLQRGNLLSIKIKKDSASSLSFIDVFSLKDSVYYNLESSRFEEDQLELEIEEDNTYKIIIQPEIDASSYFTFEINRNPVYLFPVSGGKNSDAQSFWGANRDGGKRSHEGVDIFAKRGTPVVAAVDGRIASSGEKGLGGKQVWLQDRKRSLSLYYAHLDSIAPIKNYQVSAGDTLGFVGNTGNARTTAPHLHFGIYSGYSGAINPYQFIKQNSKAKAEMQSFFPENQLGIVKAKANLRNSNSLKFSDVIENLSVGDTIEILGKTEDWYHVKTEHSNNSSFIHSSLATPLKIKAPD